MLRIRESRSAANVTLCINAMIHRVRLVLVVLSCFLVIIFGSSFFFSHNARPGFAEEYKVGDSDDDAVDEELLQEKLSDLEKRVMELEKEIEKYHKKRKDTKNKLRSEHDDFFKDLALVVLTHNRPDYLDRTLRSVVECKFSTEVDVYISQDGAHGPTREVALNYVENYDFMYISKPKNDALRASQSIARHYKFILDNVFLKPPSENMKKKYKYAILIEDDMILSYDFLNYFASTHWLLDDEKENVWCVSSWNDNGFGNMILDSSRLERTSYFPGLGWMLNRNLWEELSRDFPSDHWDHWMRVDATHKGRSCVYPQMSRNKNIGREGSHSKNGKLSLVESVKFYDTKEIVEFGDLSYLKESNYDAEIKQVLSSGKKEVNIEKYDLTSFEIISKRYGIWDVPRTHYKNVVRFHRKGDEKQTWLANERLCELYPNRVPPSSSMKIIAASQGVNCDDTCENEELSCLSDHFDYLNTCSALRKHFPCETGCTQEWGDDIPNYVSNSANDKHFHTCLVVEKSPSCSGKHPHTRRLCPCGRL